MKREHTIGEQGQPRTQADADALARFDARMALPLVLSAVIPLFLLPGGDRRSGSDSPSEADPAGTGDAVAGELAELRAEVARLADAVARITPPDGQTEG